MTMLMQSQITWTVFDVSQVFLGQTVESETGVTDTVPSDSRRLTTSLELVCNYVPPRSSALARLRARGLHAIKQSQAHRNQYGDPIQRLETLLGTLPIDAGRWQEIIDEPYG